MTFTNEQIVETKTCQKCQASFDVTDKDLEFYDKVSPVFGGKKYSIPDPTLCSDCRMQRRLSFRNERNLYKAKCAMSAKDMVSIFPENTPYTVYEQSIWWGDSWDPMEYGVDFDFNKTFFEQFKDLYARVPKCNLITDFFDLENSPYVNLAGPSKDCYFIFETDRCERCLYGYTIYDCKDCVDCNNIDLSNSCYECINIENGYNLSYCKQCKDCSDCIACINCISCQYCYGCSNLTGGKYCIFNKQYSKEEYMAKIKTLNPREQYQDIFKSSFHKPMFGIGNQGAITGDYISHSKNIVKSYDINNSENCKYCVIVGDSKDCMDYSSWGRHSSMLYECHNSGDHLTHSSFCNFIWSNCDSILYSDLGGSNSKHLFGCSGVRNKQYCILNKQYTKQEYEELVPKIIEHMKQLGEWGEFFPSSLSPFGYNETVANEYFSLSKQQAKKQGFAWSDYKPPFPKVEKTIPADKLPDNIADIPDDILNWAITCEETKKPFRITLQELKFYRKHSLPIPKRHPDQRHLDRMGLRNPRKLFSRNCDRCEIQIQTTYSPDRPERVYCERCYEKLVY